MEKNSDDFWAFEYSSFFFICFFLIYAFLNLISHIILVSLNFMAMLYFTDLVNEKWKISLENDWPSLISLIPTFLLVAILFFIISSSLLFSISIVASSCRLYFLVLISNALFKSLRLKVKVAKIGWSGEVVIVRVRK